MNTYNINDIKLKNSKSYQDFIKENQGRGFLKIKVSAASEAIPISGVNITIKKVIGNDTIIFFEGITNESGIIDNIALPAPKTNTDNLVSPLFTTYDIIAIYNPDNLKQNYQANLFDGIYVIQYINIIPKGNMGDY